MKKPRVQTRTSRLRSIFVGAVWFICVTEIGTSPGVTRAQHAHPAGQNTEPTVGAAAINFDLKTIDGKPVGLETFRGKPLVMNFFASWCDPCRDEMPIINDLASKSAKEGYNVLGIAVEDGRAAVTEYAKEAKLEFPIALDLNSTVKRAYRIFGPPATFFIDGQGVIREVVIGPIPAQRARDGLKKAGIVR
jgi:cytochrome c biogenesis protein CcmG/thiol:disulfide interchange protein DsbE